MKEKFPRNRKVVSSDEFKKIIYKGTKVSNRFINVFILPSAFQKSRFGFSVPKRIAKAVDRNKIRRFLREKVRKRRELDSHSVDIVFLVKINFLELKKNDRNQVFDVLFEQLIKRISTVC